MARRPLILLVLVVLLLSSVAFYSAAQEAQNTNSKDSGSSPIMFIENAGQWEAGARFQARGGGTILWLADDALWLTVVEQSTDDAANSRADPPARFGTNRANAERANESRQASNIKVSFVGANSHPKIETFDRLDTVVSYFIGNDPTQWRSDVPVWGGVRYVDLYPGVDLEITSENGQLVQRLAARPGADLAVVQLQVEGAEAVTADGYVLHLSTGAGEAILPMLRVDGLQVAGAQVYSRGTQVFGIAAPFTAANSPPASRPVMAEGAGSATANPAPRDASSPQSLAENPADVLYATFLGGSGDDYGADIAVDGAGSAFVAGYTSSTDFPTTAGAFDTSYSGGDVDAFVVKVDAAGSGLTYATFLGGSGDDGSFDLAVDGAGSAYVAGLTYSTDFPTTAGAFDTSYSGGAWDAFVVKLDATGSGLTYATFLGGSGDELAFIGIAVDGAGSAYVTGNTSSTDFPTTAGAFDTSYSGAWDAFVVKLDAAGSGLTYATFLGGSEYDVSFDIAVDGAGSAFVAGYASTDFPTTAGAFDTSYSGGADAFVVKLDTAGSGLAYATFLGGGGDDTVGGIAVDGAGSVYVAGYTSSTDFPTTAGTFDTSYSGGVDAFVAKFDAAGSGLTYATFLGGSGDEYGMGIAVDGAGSAFVAGYTSSTDFPTTAGAFDTSYSGGSWDAFVVKLDAAGSGLAYATYLGGSGDDQSICIAVDEEGSAYVPGYTSSTDFPTTTGAFDTSYSGGSADAFVVKFAAGLESDDVVQVTNTNGDNNPALVEAADGKLWLFFNSYRDNGYDYLWSQTSTDGGATWSSASAFTQIGDDDYDPAAASSDDGKLYVVWRRTEGGNNVWFKSSADNGATWSTAKRLTTDPNGDYSPDIIRASDGKLWVVWQSNRTGNDDIWYKTSTDDGATWSPDTQLTTSTESEFLPTVAQAADGKIWIVWTRSGGLWYQTSDGGASWSSESEIPDTCCYDHYANLVTAQDGTLWLADERAGDLWYQTSANNGASWSTARAFTRYAGSDVMPEVVALADGQVALAWHSDRGQQWWSNIWYGVVGVNADINPPPSVGWIWPIPDRPVSTDTVNITVDARDESPGLSVEVVWSKDGVSQSNVPMFDDGLHGDGSVGDNRWGGTLGTFPAGTIIAYQASATDTDGNVIVHPSSPYSLQVLAPFAKAADILFVPDFEGNDTDWFRSYYTDALDVLGYAYDVWDTELRGRPGDAILSLYTGGAIVWAVPEWGYLTSDSTVRAAMQGYLDAGGKLFIAGQNIAERLSGDALLSNYLHATYVQGDTGLYELAGAASDPIGDELTLSLSGGDGANNQGSKDEVDPVSPAETAFTYQSGASNLQAAQARPLVGRTDSEEAGRPAPASTPAPGAPVVQPTPQVMPPSAFRSASGEAQTTLARPAVSEAQSALSAAAPEANISSGTAGLRVDTGTYKVVYFAFGFEGINSASQRAVVLERVLAWLNGVLPRPGLLAPADGQAVPAGDVGFSWVSVPGASSYEIQIDTVPTFDSAGVIEEAVTTTTYTHSLTTLGMRYWRVRALPDGDWTETWHFLVAGPLVQVTADPDVDNWPSLVRTSDDTLWAVWHSSRSGNTDIWYKTSGDGGATWSADAQLTTHGDSDEHPAIIQASDGRLWVLWQSHRAGNWDIWYKTSGDGGATWSDDVQLTTHGDSDYDPAIAQASGGKLWVVWTSYRSGNVDLWYKTSADGGANWSAETQLTTDPSGDDYPAVRQASDGKLWVVWRRNGNLWRRNSVDGGATWSAEALLDGECCHDRPSLALGSDGVFWLASGWDGDIWLRSSSDDGVTWSSAERFTRFAGPDEWPALTSLADGKVGVAWQSHRSGNWDIWYGIPGEREDLDPPPYVQWTEHQPWPNPDSDGTITFRARAVDESGMADVELVWALDGAAQADLAMYDDGAHGDYGVGDGIWGVQFAPLAAGSQVTYRVRATDVDGNTYLYPYQRSFTVLAPFVKTAELLFVPDYGGNSTTWFQPYYTNALNALGYTYDVWDTGLRGAAPAAMLNQYIAGAIIWGVPYWGYITYDSNQRAAVQAYLEAGGKLLIAGQNIAEELNWNDGTTFLNNYLHATYVQGDTGLYGLVGAAGDPIGDGLALNVSGGDGANNQYSKDEIDPIGPAEAAFTYQTGASAMLQAPVLHELAARASDETQAGWPTDLGGVQPLSDEAAEPAAAPADNLSSGTAGLRVDTGTYKVVYFAFGFEGINSQAHRNEVMERTLAWLSGVQPRPMLLTPTNGHAVPTGDVSFSWTAAPGVMSYEIQIDSVPTFDSAGLIEQTVTTTNYTDNFTVLGVRYWRVRALPAGNWTTTWAFVVGRGGFICDIVTEIPQTECEALVALYNSTNGPGWTDSTDWLSTNTPCTWYGVGCSAGHLIYLGLRQNNLDGTIPPELGNLASLGGLELSFNQLTGSLPPQLGNLANLQELNLDVNQLVGSIPLELGNLANLQKLGLGYNQLVGIIPPELGNLANLQRLFLDSDQLSGSIPPELGNLANLQYLSLDYNQLSGTIPPELGNLANLQSLRLSYNQLSGSIPPELGSLANLQYLYLGSNQLSGGVPPELGNLASLQDLDLGGNQLSGSIPSALSNLSNLQVLSLEGNQLTGSIPPELGSLTNLQVLALGSNRLTGTIPPELGNLASLEELWLHGNQLSGSIPSALSNLSNLHVLYLGYNPLTGNIPPELGSLTNLQRLGLYNNQLSGSIPPALGNLANLQRLYLSSNQLSGNIPPELGSLANLQYLYLDSNQLSGGVPNSLCNPTSLSSLDLGYNKLTSAAACITAKDPDWAATQTVPPTGVTATAESGTRVALSWTPVAYTGDGGYYEVSYATAPGGPYSLHGVTSDKSATGYMVGGLAAETPYYFVVRSYTPAHDDQQNALWSELSSEVTATTLPASGFCDDVSEIPLAECQALVALYNSTNGSWWFISTGWLSTNTPCSWNGVLCINGSVTSIDLSSNNLTGNIPPQLGGLTNLQDLRLTSNNLTGSIPPELGNLANLQGLYLYRNQLSGRIPAALGNLANLQSLWLPYNQLNGSIPPEFGNMASLQDLHLGGNQLTGSIPPELGNLADLRVLYLSDNQLSGSIPPELGSLASLQGLYLSGNQLSGSIPSALGNLTNLGTLYLNSNQLSGPLPAALTGLTALDNLYFSDTDLCEPQDSAFQAWLDGISNVSSTGVACALTLTKEADPGPAVAGETLTYNLTLRNMSADVLFNDVVLIDTLPESVTFLSADPTPDTRQGNILTWDVGTLAFEGVFLATIQVQMPTESVEIYNQADASATPSATARAPAALTETATAQARYTVRVFPHAARPSVIASRSGDDITLSWGLPAVPVFHHEVWWNEGNPYFVPGDDCAAAANCVRVYDLDFQDLGAAAEPATNRSYLVLAVNEAGRSEPSNRVAEFGFSLVPGGTGGE